MAHDVDWSALDLLDIIHVGQRSTLLVSSTTGILVPVTWADRGLAPGGFALDERDGVRLRAHLVDLQRHRGSLDLGAWRQAAASRGFVTDLRLPPLPIDAVATRRAALLLEADPRPSSEPTMDPSTQRELAPALAAAIVGGDPSRTGALARSLIGSGPGATPAGDDVIVGVLAALQLAAAPGLLPTRRTREARQMLRAVVADGLPRTTAASRHQLGAALSGSFAERCLHMAGALADRDAVEPACVAARGWGATSGIDFMHGLVSTARAVLGDGTAALPATA